MKRKQPSSKPIAVAVPSKSKTAPSASSSSSSSSARRPTSSAALRPTFPDEDERQDATSAKRDQDHMDEIDEDADNDEERDGDDVSDSDDDEDMNGVDDDGDDIDDIIADDDDDEPANDDDDDASDASADDQPQLEVDLSLRIVQATYSGVLYGMTTKQSLSEMSAFQKKLHSKSGIAEEEVDVDDESNDDDEDDSDAKADSFSSSSDSSSSAFNLLFTTSAHIGSIKSLSVSPCGKWMVSGGLDESIRIFKTAVLREFGQLVHHVGSVSALEFYGSEFMLSGGQEGNLIIWNTKSWTLAKKFEGAHKAVEGSASAGGVSCIAVHPSGRVALSVGVADKMVKLWDLMKGSLASGRRVDAAYHTVKWSPAGERYILVGEKRLDVYDTSNTLLRREEVVDTRILAAVYLSEQLVVLGCEDKSIRIHSTESGECVLSIEQHAARVRGLDVISMPRSRYDESIAYFLASASTDGQTHLWDLSALVALFASATSTASAIANAAKLARPHPLCSSIHDQRVTILKILPQWQIRKNLDSKPVQTAAANSKQQSIDSKKLESIQAKQAHSAALASSEAEKNKHLSKAERESFALAKSKLHFEKAQRARATREQAAAKARRTLAKNNPMLAPDEADAVDQPKKKAKAEFDVVPQDASDDEEEEVQEEEEDEEDEVETKKEAVVVAKAVALQPQSTMQTKRKSPVTPSMPKIAPSTAAPSTVASMSDDDDVPAPRAATNKKKQHAKPAASSSTSSTKSSSSSSMPSSASAPASAAAAAPSSISSTKKATSSSSSAAAPSSSSSSSTSHAGFQSGLKMFRPILNDGNKKKKKSAAKIARDAGRGNKQTGKK